MSDHTKKGHCRHLSKFLQALSKYRVTLPIDVYATQKNIQAPREQIKVRRDEDA